MTPEERQRYAYDDALAEEAVTPAQRVIPTRWNAIRVGLAIGAAFYIGAVINIAYWYSPHVAWLVLLAGVWGGTGGALLVYDWIGTEP